MPASSKKTSKPAATKRRAKAPPLMVHLQVLQNGATMLETAVPVKRRGELALTAGGDGPFAIPHYPLPQGRLDFLKFETDGGCTLIVDHRWEGFATTKGEPVDLARASRGRRTVTMYKGDYASITCDDLRMMLKLGPPLPAVAGPSRIGTTAKAARRPFLAHFVPSIQEKRAMLAAVFAAGFIVSMATLALLKRPLERPERMADVPETYLLPFVAPDHLRHAPEALQGNLDRTHEVGSVLNYYQSFTNILLGRPDVDRSLIYPTTVELYQKLHADARRTLEAKTERQREVDRLQGMKSGVGVLTIPAVMGESMSGSMLRIIDKIGIMQQGFSEDLAARRAVVEQFPHDQEYSWEEYKNVGGKGAMGEHQKEVLASMSGAFRGMTDEQRMYAEAEGLARRASVKQARILRHHPPSEVITADSAPPIGMPDGVKFASFAADLDFRIADEKLYHLQGSDYGSPAAAPKVKEPLIGEIEPSLIERYIKENRFQLQLCYELALRRNEAAAGTMEWSWRIDSRGIISDIALVSTSIQDQRMSECIRKKIATWRFPRPRRGSIEVSYPFEFAPSKG